MTKSVDKLVDHLSKRFHFRLANAEEVESLAKQADQQQAFVPPRDEPDFTVQDFVRSHADAADFHIFATEDKQGNILAFMTGQPLARKGVWYLGPLYVVSEKRSAGLGGFLIGRTLHWALENGYDTVYTNTWGENIASRRLLEKFGFRLLREVPDARVDGDSTVLYALDLKES